MRSCYKLPKSAQSNFPANVARHREKGREKVRINQSLHQADLTRGLLRAPVSKIPAIGHLATFLRNLDDCASGYTRKRPAELPGPLAPLASTTFRLSDSIAR